MRIRCEHHRLWVVLGLTTLFVACTKSNADDSDTGLPPDTDPKDTETGSPILPDDTGTPTDVDQEPGSWLYLYQEGYWALSPNGGPYTALVGKLFTLELVDVARPDKTDTDTDTGYGFDTGDESPILCQTEYNLIGTPTEATPCPTCTFTFDIEFNVVDGDPGLCRDGELPKDGEVRTLGFDETNGTLQYDYFGSGVWMPWYDASFAGNTVSYEWNARVGFSQDMEDQ